MAYNKETKVSKNSTFEEWRQGTNQISHDVGPIESNSNKTADSLDKENRLTDQTKTVSVSNTAATPVGVALDATAPWVGFQELHNIVNTNQKGNTLHETNFISNGALGNQKFSVAANGNITLAPNVQLYAGSTGAETDSNGNTYNKRNAGATDGGIHLSAYSYQEDASWVGKTITFSGSVNANFDLDSRYSVKAFIKVLDVNNNYSLISITEVNLRTLTNNAFSFSRFISSPQGSNYLPQIGFEVAGVNAKDGTAVANTSVVLSNLSVSVSAGQGEIITTSEEFIRDQSNGANDSGMRIDIAPDKKIDMTAGYIILTGASGAPTDFTVGNDIVQYTGDNASNAQTFRARIVSVIKPASNITKILISTASGAFDSTKILGSAENFATVAQQIPAANLVRQVVGTLEHGYVRVYKTNGGTTTKLEQNVSDAAGFHLPRVSFALPMVSGNALPAAFLLEGERVYQTANGQVENAVTNPPSFEAKILTSTVSDKYSLGIYGGFLLYDVIGTFFPARQLRCTSTNSSTVAANRFDQTAEHTDYNIDNTFSSIIRLNTPAVAGDSFEMEFSSAVDAIVELQDDIGTVEDLATNGALAGFGASAVRKTLTTTDLVTTLNTLQDMVGNAVIPTITNNTHLVPNNVSTISDATKNIVTFIGDTNLSDANLGATSNTSSTLTDAITSIKTFVGSTDISDITTGENITAAVAQLHDEIGDVTLLNASATTTAGGFSTQVVTSSLVQLRSLVSPAAVTSAFMALDNGGTNYANGLGNNNLVSSIVELRVLLGDKTGLNQSTLGDVADTPSTIVAAINNIKAYIGTTVGIANIKAGTSDDTITGAIKQLHDEIGDQALTAGTNYNTSVGTLSAAIHGIQGMLGDVSINNIGAANNVSAAISGLHGELGNTEALDGNPNTFVANTTESTGGFASSPDLTNRTTVFSALQELRRALVGDGEHLDQMSPVRSSTTRDATITFAKNDLNNLAGFSKTNVIDAILEIQNLMGNVTSLTNDTNDFNTAKITDSLVELKTALVGTGDLTDTIATLDDDSTDFTGTNIVDAITEIQADLGQQSLLTASPFHAGLDGNYASTDFQLAINGITAAIGNADIGAAVNAGNNETLTGAIRQLRIDIGDVGDDGVSLTPAATNIKSAINELDAEIGTVSQLNNATGYTQTTVVPAITEIQYNLGLISATAAGMGSINTRRQRFTSAASAAGGSNRTILMTNTTGIFVGMRVLNVQSGNTDSIADDSRIVTVNENASVVIDKDIVSDIAQGDQIRFDAFDVANAVKVLDENIGAEVTAGNMGTTATTIVDAIKETTDELGAVTASNLGTTSSTITTAIKEVVDGTGAATVTVAGIASQQPTGKLDSVSATKQTIIGDIDFNSPNNAATTTLKFGTGTVLDVSAGTLKMSDATAAFNISSTFLNLQGTADTGQGLQIDRSTITGANVSTGNDAFFQWKEASISTDNPAAAHNQNDIAWQIRGLTSATSPVHYTQANVDFQNAYRLFGIGSGGNANSMTNVTVAWDDADKNFDISLNDSATDMTSGSDAGNATYGTTAKIPQITVDRQGRISAMTEVDMSGFLGTFNVLGDTGTQAVAATNNLKFVGTSGEIETAVTDESGTKTVTIGLPDNVDIDGTFGAAGNVTLASGNAADSTIAIGGTNTTTTIAGTLNIPGTLNVTGTNNSVTVSNTTITGDALILRTDNDNIPANTDSPKFVVNRGFSETKNINALVAGKRYKITVTDTTTNGGFTALGAQDNNVGTVFTATGSAGSDTGGRAKEQRSEAAISWSESHDHFFLTRGPNSQVNNPTAGAIIAQGDTLISGTKHTVGHNNNNEFKQLVFVDVTNTTSSLQRDSTLQFNPLTNTLKIDNFQCENLKYGEDDILTLNTVSGTKPLTLTRLGTSDAVTQSLQIGVADRTVDFNYFEDTVTEGKNSFGTYQFILNGNHGDADEVTDRIGLQINKDTIVSRGLSVTHNGINVTGTSSINGTLNHTGSFNQELADVSVTGNKLGRTAGNSKVGAQFSGRVGHAAGVSKLQIKDVRMTTQNVNEESSGTAAKRIQHVMDSSSYSFLDFQGSSTNVHEARLGGQGNGLTKTYFKGQSAGASELYHNVASGTNSAKKLETTTTGVKVTGTTETKDLVFPSSGSGNNTINTTDYAIRRTDDDYALHFDSLNSVRFNLDTNNNGAGSTFEIRKNGSTSQKVLLVDEDGSVRFFKYTGGDTDTSGATGFDFNGLTSNVGIGESALADFKLHVAGTINTHNFQISRTGTSTIQINDANTSTADSNRVILSNSTNTDKLGVLRAQSAVLGTSAGDISVQASFKSNTANGSTSYLQILDENDGGASNTSWMGAHKRLEFGVNNTRMTYLAQNLNENYGFEIGSAGAAGGNVPFAEQPWIRFRRATSGNGPGAVELYHGNAGTSTKKLETNANGVEITGKVGVNTSSPDFTFDVTSPTGYHANGDFPIGVFQGSIDHSALLKVKNIHTNTASTAAAAGIDLDAADMAANTNGSVRNRAVFLLRQRTQSGTGGETTISAPRDFKIRVNNKAALTTSSGTNAGNGNTSTAGTLAMVVQEGGNVGIGVGDPDQKLEVGGSIRLSGIIDQNSTSTNTFAGQIDSAKDVKTTAIGKGFYAWGGGSDYLHLTHDGSGGHIQSSDKLEIGSPIFKVLNQSQTEVMIEATQDDAVKLYHNGVQKLHTQAEGVRIGTSADNVPLDDLNDGDALSNARLTVGQIKFDSGVMGSDNGSIRLSSNADSVQDRIAMDFILGDNLGTATEAETFRFRVKPYNLSTLYPAGDGNPVSLVEIFGKNDGSTMMDLTASPIGSSSEVKSDIFTGNLVGNADTATTLSATLTVAKGGTGTTSFANKAVIISQDSGTDTLAAVTMSTNGQLLIGGTSGPAAATLTAGDGIDITNNDNSITIAAETATSSNPGVAKFSEANFNVNNGNVFIKNGGIETAEIQNNAVTFAKMQNVETNTIMGRTADNNGDPKALTAAEARGVLNVADGADAFGAIKIRHKKGDVSGTSFSIGSNGTITFKGIGATDVTTNGSQVTINSINSTYTASKGLNLVGSEFSIKGTVREYTRQKIGSKNGYYADFNGDSFALYNSQSTSSSALFQPAVDADSAVTSASNHRHKSALSGLWSAKVDKITPTSAEELTSKYYVDRMVSTVKQKLSAATFGRDSRLGTGTSQSATQLSNCTASRNSVGVYTITIDDDVRHGTSGHGHIVASLNANALQYAAEEGGGTIHHTTSANDFTYGNADPRGYIITAYPSTEVGYTGTFHVRTYKLSTDGGYIPGNHHVQHPTMELVDIPFSVIIYNGEG